MTQLHFLRAEWFLALLPVGWLAWRIFKSRLGQSRWYSVVDAELAPHVLETRPTGSRNWLLPWLLVAAIPMIVALSGPVWERKPQPVFQGGEKLVMALDLSRSMNVKDIRPSRLVRARHKLGDMLDWLPDAQSGLLAFSQVPYTISPITDDVDTIKAFFPALTTDVVPVQGSNIALALEHAGELLQRAQADTGRVVLITDSAVNSAAFEAAQHLKQGGYQLSVLGVGTTQGGPVMDHNGNQLRTPKGEVIVAQLDRLGLQDLAASVGGVYSDLTSDDSDLAVLLPESQSREPAQASARDPDYTEQWVERAPWLIPLIMLLALPLFRRGVL